MPKQKPLSKDALGRDIQIGDFIAYAAGSSTQASYMLVGIVVSSQVNTVKAVEIDEDILNYVNAKTSDRPEINYYSMNGKSSKALVIDLASFDSSYGFAKGLVMDELQRGNIKYLD